MKVPDAVGEVIAASTRWNAFEHHAEVDSTNALVVRAALAGAEPGLVVSANRQTAGRGRLGRRWEDQPGGSLLVSCLVAVTGERTTLLPLAAGLALRDAIVAVGVEPAVKWPNDLLIDGRKCGGILVDAFDPAGGRAVVGIGVNVDWRGVERTGDASGWTSLAEELGGDVDRWVVLADLLAALDRWLARDRRTLIGGFRKVCATLGHEVHVETPGGVVVGTAVDVDHDGALVVRCDGETVAIPAGDVTHVRRP